MTYIKKNRSNSMKAKYKKIIAFSLAAAVIAAVSAYT